MKEYLKKQPRSLSMSQMEELIEYDAWLDTRGLTLRAADTQATTDALIANIVEFVHEDIVNLTDEERNHLRAFLRERLVCS